MCWQCIACAAHIFCFIHKKYENPSFSLYFFHVSNDLQCLNLAIAITFDSKSSRASQQQYSSNCTKVTICVKKVRTSKDFFCVHCKKEQSITLKLRDYHLNGSNIVELIHKRQKKNSKNRHDNSNDNKVLCNYLHY